MLPPREVRGPLSTVSDRSDVTGVPRLPGPNLATTSSPGLATAAAAPPTGVPMPADDPAGFALVLARMAGELFTGASVVPAPLPADAMSGTGFAAPGSPGIAPQLAPSVPAEPTAGMPGSPVTPAVMAAPAQPASSSLASSAGGVPSGGGGALPPTFVVPGTAWDLPPGLGSPGGIAAPTNGASSAWSAPDPARGTASEPTRPGATAQRAPATSPPPAHDASPFGAFELPVFGDGQPASVQAMPDAFRLPMFDATALDAAPYFLPEAEAVSIDAPALEASEPRRDEPAIRELGGVAFDPYAVRKDFPILDERVHGKRLVWLDNAATTQKPRAVIDRLTHFYEHENSNVHRAAHTLAARATDAFESARETTRKFLGASSASEIIFVRGATEGINLIAQSWGRRNIEAGDEIVLSHLEHHANIVPWQMLCAQTGARLRIAPVDDRGDVILEEYEKLLNTRTRLVSFTQVSNALGTITPAREMIEIAHRYGAHVLLDGAQAVSHMAVDVQALDCDFYVFSGHKVFAPTGIGAVFGKRDVLAAMPPWQGGGNMIQDVTFERTVYNPPPGRFEAGTGNIADAAGLGAALDYVMRIGMDQIDRYEHELLGYATEHLMRVPGLRMIGTSPHKAGVLSFVLDGQRTEDVGAALDKEGIAVRSGHHCAQPILRRFGLESSVRASLAFYNVCEDIDALVDAVTRLQSHRRSV